MNKTPCDGKASFADDSSNSSEVDATLTAQASSKIYVKPKLTIYGDVRDITLGGSLNPGDPGVPGSTRRNF